MVAPRLIGALRLAKRCIGPSRPSRGETASPVGSAARLASAPSPTVRLIASTLAALVALTPLSLDTYLPAIPTMADQLDTTVAVLQRSISSFLLGYALGQLVGGPLSDHAGRIRVATFGLSIFMVSTLAIAFTRSATTLVVLRFFQALGGGAATVISGAIVRDLFHGRTVARVMSLMSTMILGAPLVAPLLGAVILEAAGWRAIFFFLFAYALLILVIIRSALQETAPKHSGRERESFALWDAYGSVFSEPRAMGFLIAQSSVSGGLFAYITTAPFVFIEHFGVSTSEFPLYFGMVVSSMILGVVANMRLLHRFEPRQLLLAGMAAQLLAGAILAVIVLATSGKPPLAAWIGGVMLVIGTMGLITPNSAACFLEFFGRRAGSANALYGASMFMAGGLVGGLLSSLHGRSLVPIALTFCGTSAFSLSVAVGVAKALQPVHEAV